MTTYYGPATWFLTISPSEWMWSELGDYLWTVNPPKMAHFLISELIAADPVSTSRLIENKLRATLDYITSDDCPLVKYSTILLGWRY